MSGNKETRASISFEQLKRVCKNYAPVYKCDRGQELTECCRSQCPIWARWEKQGKVSK